MAEGFWEQAVETYLAIDRGVFLNPQYLIGEPGIWEANTDFLALCFPDKTAWMVEVTKTPSSRLFGKLSTFEIDYSPRIRDQLTRHAVITAESRWDIGLWLFVPRDWQTRIKERSREANIGKFLVTPLEDTTFPSWDQRFR